MVFVVMMLSNTYYEKHTKLFPDQHYETEPPKEYELPHTHTHVEFADTMDKAIEIRTKWCDLGYPAFILKTVG
jgi:hypothetical protein